MNGITAWNDRVAVVTGGASGIGAGIAGAFERAGAIVIVADRDESALAKVREAGGVGVLTDVTDPASVQALAEWVRTEYGRVDLIVNNAGVGPKAPTVQLSLDDWRWVLEVNLFGVIHGVHAFLPHLLDNPDGGWIVNTGSMSRFFTPPGYAPYVASKAAVEGLSLSLAAELEADGADVGVTVLHPGAVRTNIRNSLRNRPAGSQGALEDFDIAQKIVDESMWIDPDDAGEVVLRAVRHGDRFAFTHPGMIGDVDASFAAVREELTKYS